MPSAAIVTLPPPVVAKVPTVAATPPPGRSLPISVVVEPTNGVAGEAVVPPVMTNCVLSTRWLPAGYESATATGAIEMENACEPVQLVLESVAVTVKLNVPVAVGVPLNAPALESDRPVGERRSDAEGVGSRAPRSEEALSRVGRVEDARREGTTAVAGHGDRRADDDEAVGRPRSPGSRSHRSP